MNSSLIDHAVCKLENCKLQELQEATDRLKKQEEMAAAAEAEHQQVQPMSSISKAVCITLIS